eukprot:5532318-Amphidinium_carterae.2
METIGNGIEFSKVRLRLLQVKTAKKSLSWSAKCEQCQSLTSCRGGSVATCPVGLTNSHKAATYNPCNRRSVGKGSRLS